MTEPVMVRPTAPDTSSITNALLIGFEDGKCGNNDTIPHDASPEWAEYYYVGYIDGARHRKEVHDHDPSA
jgi:hypothetical protein